MDRSIPALLVATCLLGGCSSSEPQQDPQADSTPHDSDHGPQEEPHVQAMLDASQDLAKKLSAAIAAGKATDGQPIKVGPISKAMPRARGRRSAPPPRSLVEVVSEELMSQGFDVTEDASAPLQVRGKLEVEKRKGNAGTRVTHKARLTVLTSDGALVCMSNVQIQTYE